MRKKKQYLQLRGWLLLRAIPQRRGCPAKVFGDSSRRRWDLRSRAPSARSPRHCALAHRKIAVCETTNARPTHLLSTHPLRTFWDGLSIREMLRSEKQKKKYNNALRCSHCAQRRTSDRDLSTLWDLKLFCPPRSSSQFSNALAMVHGETIAWLRRIDQLLTCMTVDQN